jgi:two-component system LytT family sensor kinase
MDEPSRRSGPTLVVRWGLLTLIATLIGLLNFSVALNAWRAEGVLRSAKYPLLLELTGAYSFFVLLPPVLALTRRYPIAGPSWRRHLSLHVLAFVPFSIAHTLVMWGSRVVLYRLLGWGPYDYGDMRYRFPMEAGKALLGYLGVQAAVALVGFVRREQDRKLAAARLERELFEARLAALKMQLNPHFLFNTLNMIASQVREEPARAEAMIAHLADFLRLTLRHSQAQQVPLATELEFLDAYLVIMKARFEERLLVERQIDPGAGEALVPQLLLQPLVENAITHAMVDRRQPARLRIGATKLGARLQLVVEDNGPGIAADGQPLVGRGVGLTNTAERLRHLYGEDQALTLATPDGGGLRLEITLPYRRAVEDAEPRP